MSYRLINANALNGVISNDDYEKVLNAPCIFADLPNGLDGEHYNLQEPKTGHWISHREHCENLGVMPSGLGAYEWCSNCDCGIDVREWHRNYYNYCPNCGAKMEEVEK